MKMKQFIEATHIPAALVRAVSRQIGGWESFTNYAEDIQNNGADGGFCGFIYYRDTLAFFRRNRTAIMEMTEQMADDLGEGMLKMIASFNCLRSDELTEDDIAKALYTSKGDDAACIQNAMAWFALEEVACSYCDCKENANVS